MQLGIEEFYTISYYINQLNILEDIKGLNMKKILISLIVFGSFSSADFSLEMKKVACKHSLETYNSYAQKALLYLQEKDLAMAKFNADIAKSNAISAIVDCSYNKKYSNSAKESVKAMNKILNIKD